MLLEKSHIVAMVPIGQVKKRLRKLERNTGGHFVDITGLPLDPQTAHDIDNCPLKCNECDDKHEQSVKSAFIATTIFSSKITAPQVKPLPVS